MTEPSVKQSTPEPPDFFWFQLYFEQGANGVSWQDALRGKGQERVKYRPFVKWALILGAMALVSLPPAYADGVVHPAVGVVAAGLVLWAAVYRRSETLNERARRAADHNLLRIGQAKSLFEIDRAQALRRGRRRIPDASQLNAQTARIERETRERLDVMLRVLGQQVPPRPALALQAVSAEQVEMARRTRATQRQIAREDAARRRLSGR